MIQQDKTKSVVGNIIDQMTKALNSIVFTRSIPKLLFVISSLITNHRHQENDSKANKANLPTETLFLLLLQKVADLQTQKGFGHKEAIDYALAMAMQVLGPEVLLNILPFNLKPSDRCVAWKR